MKTKRKNYLSLCKILYVFLIFLSFFPTLAISEETYVFGRMWPTLQQPWYFSKPEDIAIDGSGNVYVADSGNHRIQKLTAQGQLITKWGGQGSEEGKFLSPSGIATDSDGFVYVADWGNQRIQKFTTDGQFVTQWREQSSEDGQIFYPSGIAVDSDNYVYVTYVADWVNDRIQKFTAEGQFVLQWDRWGENDYGFFNYPEGIAVDNNGIVYVVDMSIWVHKFTSDGQHIGDIEVGKTNSNRGIAVDNKGFVYITGFYQRLVWKFTSDGQFVTQWGSYGRENGEFYDHTGVASDNQGFVYVADTENDRIQKFRSNGEFVASWGGKSEENGMFNTPSGVVVDSDGFVYVIEWTSYSVTGWYGRIQKFTPEGEFLAKWDRQGSDGEGLKGLYAIAIDNSGFLYVADTDDHQILKFTVNGEFVTQWGGQGSEDGRFFYPCGIAVDSDDYVYVADWVNHRIQKFTAEGQFVGKWDNQVAQQDYGIPESIAVYGNDFVYLAATDHFIRKFTTEGQLITRWGGEGSGDGKFREPHAIAVDSDGFVYVADWLNQRVQKFSSDGEFLTKFGEFGSDPGQLNLPNGLCVDRNGKIYVTEGNNNRVQVYKKVNLTEGVTKAIIVAGGGPYPGNNLWDATQMCANFAYRTLTYQGFTKESIYFLTSDTDLDLDNNGVLDDVDGNATNTNLQQVISTWAADSDNLFLYLVDHGGNNTFRMSGAEILSAFDLDSWLDSLQASIDGKVTVIYDACESGSFLLALTPPAGKERVVITSTSPGESAYFVTQGTVSFSGYFWTHIFNGLDVKDAFKLATDALQHTTDFQNPLLDVNSNGLANEVEDYTLVQNIFIGNGTVIHGDIPVIGNVSDLQTISGTTSALLAAYNATDNDGIARVWATIRPPDYNQESSDNPVQDLPSIDLESVGGNRYEVTYNGFNIVGTYQIAIYAIDSIGNTSIPKLTTVSVENPLGRKAIIVAGGNQSDTLWPAIKTCAGFAYEALTFQGYSDDDIYFMSPVTFSTGVDGTPTISNLNYAITTWAQENTQNVVLYLVGNGELETFQINETESLLASDLDGWLDSLQNAMPGKLTVVYDANSSGSFLSALVPPSNKERILISSTDSEGPAYFPIEGSISFSSFFWRQVLNGANVRDAFVYTLNAVGYACQGQEPMLDDSGNGFGNEQGVDGRLAREYTIGTGIILAGDAPLIVSVSSDQILDGEKSATIWVEDVTSTGVIDKVYALIAPPGYSTGDPSNLLTLELSSVGNSRYEGAYCCFISQGTYTISVYAVDTDGNVSLPKETRVEQTVDSGIDDENFTYFPHIASDDTWETEICVINTNAEQCLCGELKAFSKTGQKVDSKLISLTPNARRENIVGNEFSNSSEIGYIILESDSHNVCGYLKFYIDGKYRVAIPAARDVNTEDIYISHVASDADWTTGISILNTTPSSKDLFIDFDNGTTRAITVSGNEHKAFTVRDLFGGIQQPNIESAVIKNGNGIIGLEIFGTTAGSGLNYLSGILLKDETTTTLYYPHIASDATWDTGVVAYNPSDTSCELTIKPYTKNGSPLSPQTLAIAGKQKYIGAVENLNLPDGTAWFGIEASSPITGFELFTTKDGNQLGGYTGVGISKSEGVFAKIDKDGGTGIAFVNIEGFSAALTMTAYDDGGSIIATENLNLSAYEKIVAMPSALFSQNINTATYISYSSSGNVVGFQLNVSSDGMMLDALPGM